MQHQAQSMTPNDKPKYSVTTNVYSQDKRISGKFSKVSGLSLSDMGEYNDAEKERILAILEE